MSYRIVGLDDAQNPVPYACQPEAKRRKVYDAIAAPFRQLCGLAQPLVVIALVSAVGYMLYHL